MTIKTDIPLLKYFFEFFEFFEFFDFFEKFRI